MSELKHILHSEVQLLGWGETRKTGPYITLRLLDPELLEVFRGLDTATAKKTGHIFNIVLTEGDILDHYPEETPEEKPDKPYADEARQLAASGWITRPDVIAAIGTHAEFTEWVQIRKCKACGSPGEYIEETGETKCQAAHVRRAGESGTAYKQEYNLIPLCYYCHSLQHQEGESALITVYNTAKNRKIKLKPELHKDILDNWAKQYLHSWAWGHLKDELEYESMAFVPPAEIFLFVFENHLDSEHLPVCYQG